MICQGLGNGAQGIFSGDAHSFDMRAMDIALRGAYFVNTLVKELELWTSP